jgi:hypothetical protein
MNDQRVREVFFAAAIPFPARNGQNGWWTPIQQKGG